ncbi:VanZ family protein [Polaribacter sp. IC073]|uniref:VanZ family protein n=1 Tax=Polaribacter sp. IC073 TaxID=2508540 RepID=UPI001CB96BBB|nr:VanZ family protein [Polaribacter sp. IC073]
MRVPKYDISISHLDKWQHCLAYFTLSLSWLFAVYKENKKYLIVFACVVFGIIIEILQHTLTNYRTGDYFDVIANSLGVLIGLLVYNQVFKKNLLK